LIVKGVGVDVISIEKFKRSVERGGRGFLERIFTKKEIEYCFSMGDPYPHLAGRFCVKEAVLKSLGLGIGGGVKLRDIEVCLDKCGRPYINAMGSLRGFMDKMAGGRLLVSMSHSEDYAVAVAILTEIDRKEG